ncbi:hypothetical protein Peur_022197 [Populus x canadensis]
MQKMAFLFPCFFSINLLSNVETSHGIGPQNWQKKVKLQHSPVSAFFTLTAKHVGPAVLSMANAGPNTNGGHLYSKGNTWQRQSDRDIYLMMSRLVDGGHARGNKNENISSYLFYGRRWRDALFPFLSPPRLDPER